MPVHAEAAWHYNLFAVLDPSHSGIGRQATAGGAATLRTQVSDWRLLPG